MAVGGAGTPAFSTTAETRTAFAVVGCGYWGSNHLRVLAEHPDVSVIPVDATPGRAAEAAARHGLSRSATRLDDVLDRVDAVVVCTPPSSHFNLAVAAIEAGCDLLIEKPITVSPSEAEELSAIAESFGRTVAVGHTFLFSPGVEALAAAVRTPAFGRILHVNSDRLSLGLYRDDVDVVWDLAPHDVSILNYVLGGAPESIEAWGSRRLGRNNDIASLRLYYEEVGVTATVNVSWLNPEKVRKIVVVGEHQMAVLDETCPQQPLSVYDMAAREDGEGTIAYRNEGLLHRPHITGREPLVRQLEDFMEARRLGRPPRSDVHAGRAVVDALAAADRALLAGRRVRVQPQMQTIDLTSNLGAPTR